MAKQYRHLFLVDRQESSNFKSKSGGGGERPRPSRNKHDHSEKLRKRWQAIWAKAKDVSETRSAVSLPVKDGVHVEFEGSPGYELMTKSLEDRRAGIRLLNVYTVKQEHGDSEITRATIFIPSGKQNQFLDKLNQYATKTNEKSGKPKHANLAESIEQIRLAVLESFWRDETSLMPDTESVWCEIWLRDQQDDDAESETEQRFRALADQLQLEVRERSLRFPERTVLLGRMNRKQLENLIESCDDLAELRRAKETADFFAKLENAEQTDWAIDLQNRLQIAEDISVAVCVLDTGANNGHLLLEPMLDDSDCHTVDPNWKVTDHDGHGTMMCGLAAYGDLSEVLQSTEPVYLVHCLESVKILPPKGNNDPDLYGEITIQGVSRAEIEAPARTHIACMAVTSKDARDRGKPSSWSAAVDKLTSGYDDDEKRLMIVSAGNVEDHDEWSQYPDSNMRHGIHDPGQSWNALTVGAYTEKVVLNNAGLADHQPLAEPGELSPFSSTSMDWDRRWPVKPDIVMEGGNVAQGPDGCYYGDHDDLSLLTTGHQPTVRQFDVINATSAAAAQAAWMAARIQQQYPDAWPETIRALMIHAANWPESLKKQFGPKSDGYSKSDYANLLKVCGYGVPDLERALASQSNALTMISQAEIQPYDKNGSNYPTNEMHLYRLPWPREVLLGLGEAPVKLRITLSYFIEPGPGEIGWKDKYRYASHGLRFDLNNTQESESDFSRRINRAARTDDEKVDSNNDSGRWLIGVNGRNHGSVQSDIWEGTAADIASCNLVGVYPIIGWWRERNWLNRYDRKARYSLIVSLQTPEQSVDIYTPVAVQLGIPVRVQIPT